MGGVRTRGLGRRVGFRGRVECFEVGDGVGGVVSMVPNPQDRSERSNPKETRPPLPTDRERFREGRGTGGQVGWGLLDLFFC